MQPLPIQNCYWVIPGKFLAGEYPRYIDEAASIDKIQRLVQAGVSAFIDLTEEDEGLLPYHHLLQRFETEAISHQRFAIRDVSVPNSTCFTRSILDAVDRRLEQDRMV